ncbi:MAG: 3-oxoacyl-[acyl-carrier-protein] synthase III C-terminal domain-containing protein [Alphaproteobacteria bacterium]
MSDVGITAYGAYLPKRRLNRAAIAAANAWMNPALKGLGRGTKAMCNWDEDSLTMAVEAGRDCLTGLDRGQVGAMSFASTTLPFADRHNAGLVRAALTLSEDVRSGDVGGSQRAGTSGLVQALEAQGSSQRSGATLYLAADHRHTRPGSALEMQNGDGAAALLLGTENLIAKYLGGHSLARDLVDHYRDANAEFDYALEERWIRDMGYDQIVPEAVAKALSNAGISADAVDHFIMPATQRNLAAREAKKCGISPDAVRDNLSAQMGEAGTAHAIIMLVHALEEAEPGQTIMVVGFGQGADVLLFETTGAIKSLPARSGVTGALARGVEDDNYPRFLSFNGLLDYEWGIRAERDNRTAQSTFYRKRDAITSFMGGKCTQCGTVQFPKTAICVNPNCGARDTQEDHPFAETEGQIKTFTEDNLAYSPNPPLQYGNVAFADGGNVYMDLTDFEAGTIAVGNKLKMVFRIKDFDDKRGFRRYFWKAAPAE